MVSLERAFKTRRVRLKSTALIAAAIAPIACVEGPTAIPEEVSLPDVASKLSMASVTTNNLVSDGITEIELQPDGLLRVRDISTGDEVFAELDAELMSATGNLINAYRVGDANYNALETLNPYENAPPGFEPFRAGLQPYSSDGVVALEMPYTGGGSAEWEAWTPTPVAPRPLSIILRRAPEGEIVSDAASTGLTPLPASLYSLSSLYDGPTCMGIAEAIGHQRYNYLQGRRGPLETLGGLAAITGAGIKWVDGKPVAKLAAVQAIFASAASELSNFGAKSVHLNMLRGMYNLAGCQGAILVNPSPPSNHFPVWPGGPGWSSNNTCYTQYEYWQMSLDGGQSWTTVEVVSITCSPNVN